MFKKAIYLPGGVPKNRPFFGRIDVAFAPPWISLVIGEAMTLEGPTIIRFGGEGRGTAVTFPAGSGFIFAGCVVRDTLF
jgi:hypothetical protein